MTRTLRERLTARDAGLTVRHVRTPSDDTRQNAQNRAGRAEGLEMGQHTLTHTREPQAIVANATAPPVGTLVRVVNTLSPYHDMTGTVRWLNDGDAMVELTSTGLWHTFLRSEFEPVERAE